MLEGRTIAVVVPAYDEAERILGMLAGIPTFVDHIVVVDDASNDCTSATALRSSRSVELIRHPVNLGVGAAIASGCRRAVALGVDLVAVMAGDGQMDAADLPRLLQPLIAGGADYVKGNRLSWPTVRGSMPLHRWAGNHLFSLATRHALRTDITDSQCGYVAMNRRVLIALDWDGLWRGYGYPNDLLSQLTLRGLRIEEAPVRPVYGSERSGIRLQHVLWIIPFVIARAWLRRRRRGAIEAPWPTSTSSTAMQTASVRSPSSAAPTRAKAL